MYYNKSSSSSDQWRSMLAEICVCTCFFFVLLFVLCLWLLVKTFCVTHWRWSKYIGLFSLVNFFLFRHRVPHCFPLCGCSFIVSAYPIFFFFKVFVHRKMKERKACNDFAQPTQHCAVVSTPSHTLLFAYCLAAMYWRLWLSFIAAAMDSIVRQAACHHCYRPFVLNFCREFQFL